MATEPAKTLQSLLEAGHISRAIYIDDVFAFQGEVDVEQVLGWFSQALVQSQEKTLGLITIPYPVPDDDIWRTAFREKWNHLNSDEKVKIINSLSGILNSQLSKDKEVASQLKDLFPAEFDYYEVSPSVWIKQKDQILADAPEDSRVICLFDQDLSAESGFTNTGAFSGGGLLKDLIDSHKETCLLCGILSHTIQSIEAEHDYHKIFASEYQIDGLDPRKFLPLAKFRLNEPIKFVDGLKKLLLYELCETIKQSVLDVLNEAHTTATEKIESLDIYAFDRIILKVAHQANDWEIDTIIRLFQIYQRNDVRSRLADPETASSLNDLITKTRPTSQVETVDEEYIYPRVREIRREELYEKANLITHRPIETGDIFVSNEGSNLQKFYILLAQPCDLAVRLNGTRAQKFVSLIPIVGLNDKYGTKQTRSKWLDFWSTRTVIGNFFDDSKLLAVLEFKEAITVKTTVLDLAVLDSDGFCRIDIHNTVVPNHLTEGWKILLKNWVNFYIQTDIKLQRIKEYAEDPGLAERWDELYKLRETTLQETSFPSVLPEVHYNDGKFDFGLRRIERYRQPGADGLLKSYTQFLSREAKEFDFAS
jgi:hypothetical protein